MKDTYYHNFQKTRGSVDDTSIGCIKNIIDIYVILDTNSTEHI